MTLTGGEPTIHPAFLGVVRAFRAGGMEVGVCTNATNLDRATIDELAVIGGVHCNVSLDGFRAESHGRFRGDRASFEITVATVTRLARAGLLQGPAVHTEHLGRGRGVPRAVRVRAPAGRPVRADEPAVEHGSRGQGTSPAGQPRRSHAAHFEPTAPFEGPDLDIAHIRFPNNDGKPLSGCEAGTIIYVFTPGEVTVCPYLVFAARTPASRHDPAEFIVGNIFTDADLAERLDAYRFHDRYHVGATRPAAPAASPRPAARDARRR
ncbi:MAG TPA: radical SAM protein [Actinophytocola sp.]|uniref:radical SAM protein n=1 Tax=Actinophytocola sp. TaxID=1872138 RepID=UPI002DDD78C4|nr:radical SAM protein [Actinophytocola sp.]HEV2779229.1 radical SAM protein [Actinophytocola sp.]